MTINTRKVKFMNEKIKVQIYGYWDQLLGSKDSSKGCGGCSSGHEDGGCGGCGSKQGISLISENKSSCGGCGSKTSKTTGQHYTDLLDFIKNSSIKNNVDIEFFDLNKINILDYDNIRTLDEFGYEGPFVVIGDIVRYYGGISPELIYEDVKELLQD